MTVTKLSEAADICYIAENRDELNQKYIATSEMIYSDGTNSHKINSDGYIEIDEVHNASYIVFLDITGNIFLGVYKYIAENKFKEIIDHINKIRDYMSKITITDIKKDDKNNNDIEDNNDIIITNKSTNSEMMDKKLNTWIDINNFICAKCLNQDDFDIVKNPDASMIFTCNRCKVEYLLVPSKYYIIKQFTAPITNNDCEINFDSYIKKGDNEE